MEAEDRAAALLVFHRDRLNKLRDGISRVLGAFSEVLGVNGPIAAGQPAELNRKLQEIVRKTTILLLIVNWFCVPQEWPIEKSLEVLAQAKTIFAEI